MTSSMWLSVSLLGSGDVISALGFVPQQEGDAQGRQSHDGKHQPIQLEKEIGPVNVYIIYIYFFLNTHMYLEWHLAVMTANIINKAALATNTMNFCVYFNVAGE